LNLNRRELFERTIGIFAAALASPALTATAAPPVQGLAFHPEAFNLVMADVPARMDVIWGFAALNPDFGFRVWEDEKPAKVGPTPGFMRYVAASAEAEGR